MARARRLSQRSAEWHALRQFRVTASSFAAAVGTDELRSVESALWEMVDPGARSPGPRGLLGGSSNNLAGDELSFSELKVRTEYYRFFTN